MANKRGEKKVPKKGERAGKMPAYSRVALAL